MATESKPIESTFRLLLNGVEQVADMREIPDGATVESLVDHFDITLGNGEKHHIEIRIEFSPNAQMYAR